MEFEWFWCVNIESSWLKKQKQKQKIIMVNNNNGGGYARVGAQVYQKSTYLSLTLS